jgi:hypothetical protein
VDLAFGRRSVTVEDDFYPVSVHARSAVGAVASGRWFVRVRCVSPVSIIPHLNTAVIRRNSGRSLGNCCFRCRATNAQKSNSTFVKFFRGLTTLRQLRNCPATTLYGLDDRGSYLGMRKLCSKFHTAWPISATHTFAYRQQFSWT